MKWFKHDARARNDAKLVRVIQRHGIEGYGLYFACLEIIAEELTPENFTFELEHDAELLAGMFKMDTRKVENIMRDFIELGLFELSETTCRVACYKLAMRLDNATAQNKEVQTILSNFKKLKVTSSDLKQIRLDKNRLEEKREEKPLVAAAALPAKKEKRCDLIPEGVTAETWADFNTLRKAKKAPLSPTALDGIRREVAKTPLTLEEALRECCVRGWQGFKAEWWENSNRGAGDVVKAIPGVFGGKGGFNGKRNETHADRVANADFSGGGRIVEY